MQHRMGSALTVVAIIPITVVLPVLSHQLVLCVLDTTYQYCIGTTTMDAELLETRTLITPLTDTVLRLLTQ